MQEDILQDQEGDLNNFNFIQQGSEIICQIDTFNLIATNWKNDKGISATLTIKEGGEPLAHDIINLSLDKKRKLYIKQCQDKGKELPEKALLFLEEFIRALYYKDGKNPVQSTLEYEMTPEEKNEAEKLLKSDMNVFFDKYLQDLDKLGFAGEIDNKLYLYLAFTSRLLDNPINTTVKGESSSGKNFGVQSVLDFFPPEGIINISGATTKAFFYTKKSLKNKIIVFAERNGSEESDYSIRSLQSEKKLVFMATIKNADGHFETQEIVVEGPAAFLETTTKPHIHAENETRNFDINVDDSEKQTETILSMQNRQRMNPITDKQKQDILNRWQNAQRLLKPFKIIIPFADKIKFPTKPVRVRRDYIRFLALIEASTLFFQLQRRIEEIDGINYLVATPYDYGMARRIAMPILKNILVGATPKCKQLVEAVQKTIKQASDDFIKIETVSRPDLEKQLGWDTATVNKYANEAIQLGCLEDASSDNGKGGRGKRKEFAFIKPVQKADIMLQTQEELEQGLLHSSVKELFHI